MTFARRLLLAPALAATVAVGLAAPAPARADSADLLASLYTDTGYELRRDDQLFALFCAFNAAGFDGGQQTRALPFPGRAYPPLRDTVRQALASLAPAARAPIDRFLDQHPASLSDYERAALLLGAPPDFAEGAGFPAALHGLGPLLAQFAKDAHLDDLARSTATAYRKLYKSLRGETDGPFAKLRAAYRLDENTAPLLVLVPEPLDAPGDVIAAKTADGSHLVEFGLPGQGPLDLKPALEAYSRLLAADQTAKVTCPALAEALTRLQAAKKVPTTLTPAQALTGSLARAVAAKLWSADPQANVAAAMREGYLLTDAFLAALAQPASAFPSAKGTFVAQVAQGFDGRKAVEELVRSAEIAGRAVRRK